MPGTQADRPCFRASFRSCIGALNTFRAGNLADSAEDILGRQLLMVDDQARQDYDRDDLNYLFDRCSRMAR